jgi:hypothetical protein
MHDSGWLFDLYPEGRGMRLWFIREDGSSLSLWDRYAPSFYARTDAKTLEHALGRLALRPVELHVKAAERTDLQS